MKKYLLALFILICTFSFGEEYTSGKIVGKIGTALENNILTDVEIDGQEIKDVEFYNVKLRDRIVQVEVPIYGEKEYNLDLEKGTRVVLAYEEDDYGKMKYYITDIDKRFHYGILLIIFVGFTIMLAKFKGVKAILSLLVVILGITYGFIPFVAKGYSPIMLAVMISIFASFVTIAFTTGFDKKGKVAIISSVLGTFVAGILSMYFVQKMKFTGYTTVEAIGYIDLLRGIKVKELVSAGVIIGSMGAVMDVAMSISSALSEIKRKHKEITPHQLFASGITIGKDIVGTMVNTLILAYIGSSLFDVLIIYINLQDLEFIRILNYEFIGTEILRGFLGSIGILAVIPITSYLCAHMKEK
ncbi:YibE/F family protein [Fusobacterium sp. MFO224]|uniref:YibE/F family protein n=1 Tax=Fusobacterium sp. MFO224 TaxID=3378070 RepID=UPI0038519F24